MTAITTTAGDRFTDAALKSWDRDQFEATAEKGLAEPDVAVLADLCRETGEDYQTAANEVAAFCREKISS